jgi:hypothetical protein
VKQTIHSKFLFGVVSCLIGVAAFVGLSGVSSAATYTVTNTNDSGAGSFRQAIADANSNPGADQIDFSIAGAGPHTITLNSTLQSVTGETVINGLSQTGSVCDGENTELMIRLNLNGNSNAFNLNTGSSGSELNGIAVANAATNAYGLWINSDDVTVRCSFFGTFDGLTNASANTNNDWVTVSGSGVGLGGPATSDMNVFMPNQAVHAVIFNTGVTSMVVQGNYIGVGLDGSTTSNTLNQALRYDTESADSALIDNNVMNGTTGIYLTGSSGTAENIQITNNHIGTDSTGTTAFPDTIRGIWGLNWDANNVSIANNVIAVTASDSRAIEVNGQYNDFSVAGNRLNVRADGTDYFVAAGLGSTAIRINADNPSSGWVIEDNIAYGNRNSRSLDLAQLSDAIIRRNIIGTDAAKTNCFDSAGGVGIFNSSRVMFGGVDAQDGNHMCADHVYIAGTSSSISVIGNSLVSEGTWTFAADHNGAVSRPMITGKSEAGGNTELTIEHSLPVGEYRIEFFDNDVYLDNGWSADAQDFIGTVDIISDGSGVQQATATVVGDGYDFPSVTATEIDDSEYGFGDTSTIGYFTPKATVIVETTDDLDEIQRQTQNHEITQTITNLGPTTITEIDSDIIGQDCLSISGTSQSGTATEPGSVNGQPDWLWSGVLDPDQTLVITFNVDVTCGSGNTYFDYASYHMKSYGIDVSIDGTDSFDTWDTTEILGYQADLVFVTEDDTDPVLSYDTVAFTPNTHTVTQSITNNGPESVTDIEFSLMSADCIDLSDANAITVGGNATNIGSYFESAWAGQLDVGQTLQIIFNGPLTCSEGAEVYINNIPTTIKVDGEDVEDSTPDNNDYDERTDIIDPVNDISVTKTLLNPEAYATGATLQYEISLTNNGPQDFRIDQLDGSIPGQTSLFIDIMPADITFTGFTSDDDIGCVSLGPASAALFEEAMENHSDHEIVTCGITSDDKVILSNQTISGVLTAQVANDSDLQFRNYVYAAFGVNDPEQAAMAGYDGSTDLIDYLESQGPNNNLAKSTPVTDSRVTKELVGSGSSTAGATVTYRVTLENKGPMSLDLLETIGSPLIADLFPADALSYSGILEEDFFCQDLGPESIGFLGNAGMDHPNHQILICGYAGESSRVLAPSDSIDFTISFTVNSSAPDSYTNYVAMTVNPTDSDSALLLNLFQTTTEDVLDSIDNENFAKATYSTPANQVDTDDDGIPDSIEDAGPNSGDANNDGTPDSQQDHVSSFVSNITGDPVVLVVSDDCSIMTASTNAEATNQSTDLQYQYPLGFMGFSLDCGTPGYTAAVTHYYYNQVDQNYVLRKYHTTNETYTTISDASISQVQIDSRQVLIATYQVQDGGPLDVDGQANGTIDDPAGLGVDQTDTATDSGGSLMETGDTHAWIVVLAALGAVTATIQVFRSRGYTS